jgi:predicted ferric reductase
MSANQEETEFDHSSINPASLLILLIAIAVGLLLAIVVLPFWVPNLDQSLSGSSPKAFWYLSRGTAFVAMGLLWASMALGLGITNKMARAWPGAPASFAIHEYVSLLGLAFGGFHALILLGDQYSHYTLAQLLTPFAAGTYRPFWVGLGQIGFYTWAIVAVTFYMRGLIGQKGWRLVHFASFASYLMALVHGLTAGTDTLLPWAQQFYWLSGGSLLFLLMVRIVGSLVSGLERPAPARNS